MFNTLTIDVEDWHHVCTPEAMIQTPHAAPRVAQTTGQILDLLNELGTKATFFILGSVAEQEPELVRRIAAEGHEIASHGYSHTLLHLLGPDRFREELHRTASVLEQLSGTRPRGFRAPQWSIRPATPWAMTILAEEGYTYDSSCNPLPFVGDRHGRRIPYPVTAGDSTIIEIPPMVTPSPVGNLPTGGGWGLRFFPLAMISSTIEQLNRDNCPAVLYLHPREMEAATGPRLKLSPLKSFVAYGPRRDAGTRLRQLLRRFPFGTLQQVVDQWQAA